MKQLKNKSLFYFILFGILSIFSIMPFFHSGFFTMHDDTQVARVSEMFLSLADGMIPVRWVMNLGYGYGYPIFTFYAPFAYYFGAFWMMVGLDALMATKLMMLLGTVLAGVFMYFFAKDVWAEEGGMVAALFYLFAPYHAVNVYIRGAVAEVWGMAFLPLAFYGVWNTYKRGKWRYACIGVLGYAGIILSHNLTALMVTPFLILITSIMMLQLIRKKDYVRVSMLMAIFLLGIGLSAFYWLPAITEMKYTNVVSQISGTGSKFTDHFVCVGQLWNSPWGYAGSGPGCVDGVSFRIGKLHVFAVLASAVFGWFIYKKNKEKGYLILGSISLFAVTVFLTLSTSSWLWNSVSPMSYLQFPWRFLLLIVFFSSFLAGALIWYAKELLHNQRIVFFCLVGIITCMVLLLYGKLFVPKQYFLTTSQALTSSQTVRFTTSKISDEYMPPNFVKPQHEKEVVTNKAIILSGSATVNALPSKVHTQTFMVTATSTATLLLKTAPIPAWETSIDGKKIPHLDTNKGMVVSLRPGTYQLDLRYVSTQLELIGNSITLTSMVGLLVGIIYLHTKNTL